MIKSSILSLLVGSAACNANIDCGHPVGNKPTLYYSAALPEQTPPVSTVYGAIVTNYVNAVDCNVVQVENIDSNPEQTGVYTARTTVPVLTVHRVGCMPVTTSVPRGGGKDDSGPQVDWLMASIEGDFEKRSTEGASFVHNNLISLAEQVATGIDPNNDNITVKELMFLRQINTALFALNVIQSGWPLNRTCEELHNSTTAYNLDENLIDPKQAAGIVCYAAVYGLYFDRSFAQLLSDLAGIEYAIQMSTYEPETLQEVCQSLDYSAVSFLGVDTEGIRKSICNGTAGVSHTWPSTTANVTTTMTKSSNATTEMPTTTHDMSSAASAAGTVAPWFNTTTTKTGPVTVIETIAVKTETLPLPSMTSTETDSMSKESSSATPALADLPFFITPQARRAALRRHGRSII